MLAFFVYIFSFLRQSNLQNLMFVLSSWHYFKLQFFYNYNLFRRVLPFLTQRMGAIECQILIFRSSYSYLTLGISLQFNNVESNSYNCFPFSSSKCCSALPEAWAPAPMRSPCSNCRYVDNEYTDSPLWRAIIAAHEVRRTKKKKASLSWLRMTRGGG